MPQAEASGTPSPALLSTCLYGCAHTRGSVCRSLKLCYVQTTSLPVVHYCCQPCACMVRVAWPFISAHAMPHANHAPGVSEQRRPPNVSWANTGAPRLAHHAPWAAQWLQLCAFTTCCGNAMLTRAAVCAGRLKSAQTPPEPVTSSTVATRSLLTGTMDSASDPTSLRALLPLHTQAHRPNVIQGATIPNPCPLVAQAVASQPHYFTLRTSTARSTGP